MENIPWYIGIIAFIALILGIITIMKLSKKSQKKTQYEEFFNDRNLDINKLQESNKLIFQQKEKGNCKKCGRENVDIITKTGMCINCSYHPYQIDKQWYEEKFDLLSEKSFKETIYDINNIDFNKIPNVGVFAVKGIDENGQLRVIDIYQGRKIKKEINNIIKQQGKYHHFKSFKNITISILEIKLTDEDKQNIINLLDNMNENSSFVRQLIQLQYAHENIPEYWHPNAGDQADIIKNYRKNNKN